MSRTVVNWVFTARMLCRLQGFRADDHLYALEEAPAASCVWCEGAGRYRSYFIGLPSGPLFQLGDTQVKNFQPGLSRLRSPNTIHASTGAPSCVPTIIDFHPLA